MTTNRPYRAAMPWERARAELLRGRGSQWDGRVVDAFIDMIEEDRRADVVTARVPTAASAS